MSLLFGGKWTIHREEKRVFVKIGEEGVWITYNPSWIWQDDEYQPNFDDDVFEIHSSVYGTLFIRETPYGELRVISIKENPGHPTLLDILGIDGIREAVEMYRRMCRRTEGEVKEVKVTRSKRKAKSRRRMSSEERKSMVINMLKQLGEATVEEIAEEVGISEPYAHRLLRELLEDGVVERRSEKSRERIGRRKYIYSLRE